MINPHCDLTPGELRVLRLCALGSTNAETGMALGISPITVNTHLKRAYKKLGAMSRTGAIWQALRLGLIDPPTSRWARFTTPEIYALEEALGMVTGEIESRLHRETTMQIKARESYS